MSVVSRWFRMFGFADVLDDLLVGAYPVDRDDVDALAGIGVRRVLNLTRDEEYGPGEREAVAQAMAAHGIEEVRVEMIDYGHLPAEKLEAAVQDVSRWLEEGARTYLHCRAGWQRSAAVAAGVVAVRMQLDIDRALRRVQERHPSADPLPHQREDLRRWWELRGRHQKAAG
jgi:predicted protein tyrosine phosphatase